MASANSSAANGHVPGGLSFGDLRAGERLIWTQPDGARVFVIVKRLTRRTAFLECHYGNGEHSRKSRPHPLPLFPSIRKGHWTPADLETEAQRMFDKLGITR